MIFLKALAAVRAYFFVSGVLHDRIAKTYNEGKERIGGSHMSTLYQLIGYAVWYGAFISAISAILAVPFIWMPSVWHYSVIGIEITKYIIIIVAAVITFTCVTVTIL